MNNLKIIKLKNKGRETRIKEFNKNLSLNNLKNINCKNFIKRFAEVNLLLFWKLCYI